MYDGDATALGNKLKAGFDKLQQEQGDSIKVLGATNTYDTFYLLKAAFVSPKNIRITKKYTSLEASSTLVTGSPVEVTLEIKNVSSAPVKNILLSEKFPTFLKISDFDYDVTLGSTTTTGTFLSQGDSGVADLRNVTLAPGQSVSLRYR